MLFSNDNKHYKGTCTLCEHFAEDVDPDEV